MGIGNGLGSASSESCDSFGGFGRGLSYRICLSASLLAWRINTMRVDCLRTSGRRGQWGKDV